MNQFSLKPVTALIISFKNFLFACLYFLTLVLETYLTPCSTPPVSEGSISGDQNIEENSETGGCSNLSLNELNLHKKLYDSYCLELTDLQILIGRVKDNWRYALNKGSSNLHVLDRFSISLQIEIRLVIFISLKYNI